MEHPIGEVDMLSKILGITLDLWNQPNKKAKIVSKQITNNLSISCVKQIGDYDSVFKIQQLWNLIDMLEKNEKYERRS